MVSFDLKHLRHWPFTRCWPRGRRGAKVTTSAIYFQDQHGPHYSFANSSDYPVWYKDRLYPTGEHLFQAMKFMEKRPNIAEHIRTSQTVREVIDLARIHQQHIAHNWYQHEIQRMDEVLRLKFTQHDALRLGLLGTGDLELVYDSPTDAVWGNGGEKNGRNELGKALTRLRETFR